MKRRANSLRELFPIPFLAATAVFCALIFYVSSISSFPMEPPFAFSDKLVHFCMFGGLGAIIAIGLWRADREYSTGTMIIVPVAFCFAYGLSDEIHQLFVPYRTFDVSDLAADVAGAAFAAGLLACLRARKDSRNK